MWEAESIQLWCLGIYVSTGAEVPCYRGSHTQGLTVVWTKSFCGESVLEETHIGWVSNIWQPESLLPSALLCTLSFRRPRFSIRSEALPYYSYSFSPLSFIGKLTSNKSLASQIHLDVYFPEDWIYTSVNYFWFHSANGIRLGGGRKRGNGGTPSSPSLYRRHASCGCVYSVVTPWFEGYFFCGSQFLSNSLGSRL